MKKRTFTNKLINEVEEWNYNLTKTDYDLLNLIGKNHMMTRAEENLIKQLSDKYKELG